MPVGSKLIALLSISSPLRPLTVLRLVRYCRPPLSAFSYTPVFHGRFYSVFNLPKIRFWSGARSQLHSEAVVNEGCGEAATALSDSKNSHPWPEWSKLADLLVDKGYSDRRMTSGEDDDSFLVDEDLPEEFMNGAEACLGFARDRPDILRLLSKKNIEYVVMNGSPFLFRNGENSARRMKSFLAGEVNSDMEVEKAQTIDIMRYLLSWTYYPLSLSDDHNLKYDELVEPAVKKLLCELFNLTGTVWKPKSVVATLTELPLSNERLSEHTGQYIETRTADLIYPKIPGRSASASENQPDASGNITDNEYRKNPFNQNQGPEETPSSQTDNEYRKNPFNQNQGPEETPSSQTGGMSMPIGGFIENSAQPSTSVLDKNVEPWTSVKPMLTNETNAVYGSTNSIQPPSHLGNNYNTYYGGYTGNPSQQSGNLWTSSSTSYGGTTATSSPQPGDSWNARRNTSYNGYNVNSNQRASNLSSSSSTFHGGATSNSSQPSSNSWNNHSTSFTGYNVNSAQPSSTPWKEDRNTPYGGSAVNSSQSPLNESWSNYNTANSTQPPSNSWANNMRSYGDSTPNSSQPPIGYQSSYSTQYDGYNNASQTGFSANSSQPPNDTWNTYNASSAGFNEKLKQPSSNSYTASTAYSPQPPHNTWNKYNSPYGENLMKSTQPSTNSWSKNDTSFGGPITNSWNNHNANTANSTDLSAGSRNSDTSNVGFGADSYRGYPSNANQQSCYSQNSRSTYPVASTNPSQLSSSTWNNNRESLSSGFSQVNNGLLAHAQTQNASVNVNYGYLGKSLEGSCVKEPDPLDMSEEAKAERWFRRAAQIKDISELSQIPDEDFPQIMPMRKGVNRFVVSKRKTPLERRLASQQYKRSLPVVSSEPEKEPTDGEKEN